MRKLIILFILSMLLGNYVHAYDFSSVCSTGQTLFYNITSDVEPYMVEVTSETGSGYNTQPTGDLEIPETIEYNRITYSVTSIGSSAFYGCSGLTSVTIPNSVTEIGMNAFMACSGLTSVTIGNSVESIDYYAFTSCSELMSVYYTGNIDEWCGMLFANETSNPLYKAHNLYISDNLVTDLVIHNTVTEIKDYAFYGATCLTSVTIPNSVTSIGSSAFSNCSGLTSVEIPNSVTYIGGGAFNGCVFTEPIFNANCFVYFPCGYADEYIIPDGIKQIVGSAFFECRQLTSVTIPNSVTEIGKNAFMACSGLTSVIIPDSVTSIGSGAFWDCGLTGILTIPNSVASIGSGAFNACIGLTSVYIGNSVETIDYYAFDGCENITDIYMLANNPPIRGSDLDLIVFTDTTYATATLWTPCGLVDSYASAEIWSNFTNIQERRPYMLHLESSNSAMGTTNITQQPDCTDGTAVIEATPNHGYEFVSWNDGNAENPRTITVTSDSTFVANFIRDGNYPQIVDFEELPLDGENSSWIGDDGSGQFTSSYLTLYNDYESQYDTWTGFAYTNGTDTLTNTYTNLSSCVGHGAGNSANYVTAYIGSDWMGDYSPIPVGIKIDTEYSGDFTNRGAYFCMPVLLSKYVIGTDNHYASNQFYFKLQVRAYANDNLIGNREIMMADFTEGNSYMMDDWTYVDLSWLENADSLNFIAISNDTADGYGINTPLFFCMDNFGADAPVFYTIIATAGENGTITPNGEVSIGEGRSTTFTIIANEGYRISSVMVDDVDVTVELVDGVYTFENVSADHTIDASFEEIPTFTITVLSNNDSYGSVSGGGTYEEGATATLTAIPNQGYRFVSWSDDITDNPRTVTVTSDSTFVAAFVRDEGVEKENILVELFAYRGCGYSPYAAKALDNMEDTDSLNIIVLDHHVADAYQYTESTNRFYYWAEKSNIFGEIYGFDGTPSTVFDGYVGMAGADTRESAMQDAYTTYYNNVKAIKSIYSLTAEFEQTEPESRTFTLNVTAEKLSEYYGDDQIVVMAALAEDIDYDWSVAGKINNLVRVLYPDANGTEATFDGNNRFSTSFSITISEEYDISKCKVVVWVENHTQGRVMQSKRFNVMDFYNLQAQQYTITVLSNNDAYGTVSGGGTYDEGSEITLSAMPNQGYVFDSWEDGNFDNPRSIEVTSDSTFIADFVKCEITQTIDTVVPNFVTVGDHTFYSTGRYSFEIQHEADCDTIFDINLTVLAEPETFDIGPNPTSKMLNINSDGLISFVELYSTTGQLVMRKEVNGYEVECDVESLVPGVYIVRIYGAENNLPSVYKVVKE
ncbi:MAG: leucine-rich repeat protein [Bacteroidales bacterium]|nr:leucine-rich repeat protein [Bacteroidales bacterium]